MSKSSVVVMSGASSGIGRCIALELSEQANRHFVFLGRSLEGLETLGQTLKNASTYEIAHCDLQDPNSTRSELEKIKQRHPKIEWVINCAGFGFQGGIHQQTLESQDAMMAVNVRSYIDLFTILQPCLGRGSFVMNVVSAIAFLPLRGFGIYGATKAFLLHWSIVLRAELKPHGIHVTAVCPGPVKTPFFKTAGLRAGPPDFLMENAMQTAHRAIRGCLSNKAVVTTGWSSTWMRLLSKFLPYTLTAALPSSIK